MLFALYLSILLLVVLLVVANSRAFNEKSSWEKTWRKIYAREANERGMSFRVGAINGHLLFASNELIAIVYYCNTSNCF